METETITTETNSSVNAQKVIKYAAAIALVGVGAQKGVLAVKSRLANRKARKTKTEEQ